MVIIGAGWGGFNFGKFINKDEFDLNHRKTKHFVLINSIGNGKKITPHSGELRINWTGDVFT